MIDSWVWRDLSDSELLSRLLQRGVDDALAVHLVWHRDEVGAAEDLDALG